MICCSDPIESDAINLSYLDTVVDALLVVLEVGFPLKCSSLMQCTKCSSKFSIAQRRALRRLRLTRQSRDLLPSSRVQLK